MAHCSNPECEQRSMSDLTLRHHWVQIEEIDIAAVGEHPMQGQVRRTFAAVACSRECAVAVLNAAVQDQPDTPVI